jgi:uncharacterized phage-associated protein
MPRNGINMSTAMDVAKFFIWKSAQSEGGAAVSNLKLQKLIYYAKGFYQALNNSALFPEALEAWLHGPVVPSVYHAFKAYGSGPIEVVDFDSSNLSHDDLLFLTEIWDLYGQFSAWRLREMSHGDKPWLDHEADASVIPDSELGDYFKTKLVND